MYSLFSIPVATIATTLENLGKTISSDFEGNPSLYITKVRKNNQDNIYVNNALIIRSRSNVQLENGQRRKQVSVWSAQVYQYIWIFCFIFYIGIYFRLNYQVWRRVCIPLRDPKRNFIHFCIVRRACSIYTNTPFTSKPRFIAHYHYGPKTSFSFWLWPHLRIVTEKNPISIPMQCSANEIRKLICNFRGCPELNLNY